jgi:hypothetical protein
MRNSVLLFTAAFLLGIGATGQTGPTLKKITAFDLPGPAGKRFDYLTIDEDDHYLISAHRDVAREETLVLDADVSHSRPCRIARPMNKAVAHEIEESTAATSTSTRQRAQP